MGPIIVKCIIERKLEMRPKAEKPALDKLDSIQELGKSCPMRVEMVTWEFECRHCKSNFVTPVPRGPREERELQCPSCKSKDLKRLNAGNLQETACGG
jgi:Zn finger protein HypA/HybF involved in hydrogenase expression